MPKRRRTQVYFDRSVGRWRNAKGHFTKAPKIRRVQRKRTQFYFDHYTGRWRNAKGHFTKAPNTRQVRRDAIGRYIDDRGKLVARAVVRPTRRAPAKIRDKVEQVPVDTIGIADPKWSTTEAPYSEDRFPNYSHMNAKKPTRVQEVFEAALLGHLDKSPFEWDEVSIYEYGALFRPELGTFSTRFVDDVRAIIAGTGAKITIIQESDEVQSMRIRFGNDDKASGADAVHKELGVLKRVLNKVYNLFEFHFEDVTWAAFWDTDEELYEIPS